MKTALALTAVLCSLTLAACGDDDSTSTTSTDTGTSGASGATGLDSGSSTGIETAGEFIDGSIPDEVKAVEDAVAANDECEGVDAKAGGDFQVSVAIAAAQAAPDTPFEDVVVDECELQ